MKQLLLIDGDQFLYRACAACERDVRWDDENHVLASNEQEVWDTVQGALKKVFDHFGITDHVLAMGEAPYFRHKIDPGYKGGRVRKPLCFYDIRDRMRETYKVVTMPGIEADDVLGILATKPNDVDKIIVCKDKDLKQIPGKLWNGSKFFNITEAEADYFHMLQTLTGDVSDGYPGCVGVGPVKATKILDQAAVDAEGQWHALGKDLTDDDELRRLYGPYGPDPSWAFERSCMWDAVVDAFGGEDKEEDALKQARLARILRWSDWDSERKEPILWTPQKS